MENNRQFIPRGPGDLQPTVAEVESDKKSKNKSRLKKVVGVGVLATAAALSPGTAYSQTLNQDKQKAEQKDQQQIKKYQQWLIDMSAENPELVGAKISEAGYVIVIVLKGRGAILVYSKDQAINQAIDAPANFTLQSFKEAVEAGLARERHLRRPRTEIRATEPEKKLWLEQLTALEPQLKGSEVLLVGAKPSENPKATGVGFYTIVFEDGPMCEIVIADTWDTKEEFFRQVKSFLRGDTYRSKMPEGVAVDFSDTAPKVMGLTGIEISNGVITFRKGEAGKNTFSLKNAKKVIFFDIGENWLQMAVEGKNGETWVYPIKNGKFFPDEREKAITKIK